MLHVTYWSFVVCGVFNVECFLVYIFVSWPNPSQQLKVHASDLDVDIRLYSDSPIPEITMESPLHQLPALHI